MKCGHCQCVNVDNPCYYVYDGQSYGKVVYFITLFPYIVLTIFLVMGSFEEGFVAGITDYYLKVQKLPKVQAEIA